MDTDGKGYRRFYTPNGTYVVRYPATPSNPYRRLRDVLIAVRTHGLPWPPPSKKEQRSERRRKEHR